MLGDSAHALPDVLSLLRLTDAIRSEPILITQLVRDSILHRALSAIDTGIVLHAWNDEQLRTIEGELSHIDPLDQLAPTLRGERAIMNTVFERLRAGGDPRENLFSLLSDFDSRPLGMGQQWLPLFVPEQHLYLAVFRAEDQAALNKSIQKLIDALPPASEPISLNRIPELVASLQAKPAAHFRFNLSVQMLYNIAPEIARTVYAANQVLLTRLACVLERYRLKHGAYPTALEALVPEFLARIPGSAIAGQPFHYLREADTFRLWSDGWNRKDDGGTAERNIQLNDWIWNARQ
jgi:hypothetical protein